jgi:hypothetical protein
MSDEKDESPQPGSRIEELRVRYVASLQPGVAAEPAWLDVGGVVARNTLLARQPPKFDVLNSPMGGYCRVQGAWPK